jgi:ankyrin repeat protein
VRTLKTLFLAAALLMANSSWAYTDDDQVEFSGAVSEGNIPVVKKHLDAGTMKVNDKYFGWIAVLSAAAKNRTEMVKFLVERGADVDYRHPITKMTALAHAVYENNIELVEYLLQHGANPNIKLRGDVSMLRVAKDEGHTKVAEILAAHGAKEDGCLDDKCF